MIVEIYEENNLGIIIKIISKKILEFCNDSNLSVNQFASICNLPQSTMQYLVDEKSKNPKIMTIIKVCNGMNITLKEFFDDPLFNNMEIVDQNYKT